MELIRNCFFPLSTRTSCISITAQAGLIAGIPILYFSYPVTYIKLIAEDNWGGYGGFTALMIASLLFMRLFISSKAKKADFWYALFALGTFFIGMEEISWGQRIVGVGTPDFLRDMNFQGEFTLHNIKAFSPEAITYLVVSVGFIVYGFILPFFAAIFSRVNMKVKKVNLPLPSLHLAPLFLATSYFLKFSNFVKGEEIGELLFAISFGCLALDCTLSKLQTMKKDNWLKWLNDFAIPACIAFSFLMGIQLTLFWEGDNSFRNRLNQFAGVRLPLKEHYRQAEIIFAYLEKNPELADDNLMINKGKMLRKMGREEEALTGFKQALKRELRLYAKNKNDHEMLRRISFIYFALGDKESSRVFLNKAIEAYENVFMATSQHDEEKKRRTRPAWTYWIWSGKYPSKSKFFKLHIFRAETYNELREYNKSISEYLKASEFAAVAKYRHQIELGIARVLSKYCPDYEMDIQSVPWNEVEILARKFREGNSDWCGPTGKQ